MIYLIVNADDFGLSRAVSRGILESVRRGIVTSISVLAGLVHPQDSICARKHKTLGCGLHLNITLGEPLLAPHKVSSLVQSDGSFYRGVSVRYKKIKASEVWLEWETQLKRFIQLFLRMPSHVDTHHHIHEQPFFYRLFRRFARQYALPVRARTVNNKRIHAEYGTSLYTTMYTYVRYNPRNAWDASTLYNTIMRLRKGVYDIIVHPGYCDAALCALSSFNKGRVQELRAVCAREVKKAITVRDIIRITYGDLMNIRKRNASAWR